MLIKANADTADEVKEAITQGVSGIGLCRSEHMFFDPKKLLTLQSVLFRLPSRDTDLYNLKKYQRQDFVDLFEAANGLPVTIRLLDPPIHEFAPKNHQQLKALNDHANTNLQSLFTTTETHKETNPMLGKRGARLLISDTELLRAQVEAIVDAKIICEKQGIKANPEILIPMIMTQKELEFLVCRIKEISTAIPIGSMLETPAILSDIKHEDMVVDFVSFGTNDLTQMMFGISRDDSQFINTYVKAGIFKHNPFQTLHEPIITSIRQFVDIQSKFSKPKVRIGICGEHAGDFESVKLFADMGIDYLSCSIAKIQEVKLALIHTHLEKQSPVMV